MSDNKMSKLGNAKQADGISITPRNNSEVNRNALFIIGAEVLFVLLPFIVIGIVLFDEGHLSKVLYKSEWSFAGAILIGQTLVKLFSGFLSISGRYRSIEWQKISLAITLLFVLGLVPSLIVLTLVLKSEPPSTGLVIMQLILFSLGLIVFILFGWLGERLMAEGETRSG